MKNIFRTFCAASTVPLLLAACGDGSKDVTVSGPEVTAKGAALYQVTGCGDLLSQIQADAIAKLNAQAKMYEKYAGEVARGGGVPMIDSPTVNDGIPGPADGDGDVLGDGDGVDFDSGQGEPGAAPPTPSGEGNDAEDQGGSEQPKSHSDTNTQVADVDEADIVKVGSNGERLFVLHGNRLKIVDSWPAAETATVGQVTVPGNPTEMFIEGQRAVVFSHVYPEGIGSKGQDAKCADCCSYEDFVQISVFDVSGSDPVLEREMLFEGNYVSSRRYDSTVRMIVRGGFAANDLYYPEIDYYDSFDRPKSQERLEQDLENWRAGVEADIRSTTLEDWLPRAYEKQNGSWESVSSACEGYFVPEPGLVQGGVTRVVTFDMSQDAAPQMTSVLGGSDTVYSSRSTLVVTQHNWMWEEFGQGEGAKTSVHSFALDGAQTQYDASGFAPGYLINQFALHEAGGVIFLSTTEEGEFNGTWDTQNTIVTLKEAEDGVLEVLDRSDSMGEPRETIFATRYLGDRAYVVTFRQTDPLYAVDISDPADLKILGELHIPGFSDYIHPLGDHHLLTIGMETGGGFGEPGLPEPGADLPDIDEPDVDEPDGDEPDVDEPEEVPDDLDEPPVIQEGVALQIFDVSDATSPKLIHKELFGGFSHSEANHNHKAFTFVDDHFGEDSSFLTFPLVSYEPEYRAGLEVLKVSAESGFERLGTIDHRELLTDSCDEVRGECYYHYYWGEEMRRGVQIDDYMYAISQGGITVHAMDQLSQEPLAVIDFEEPSYEQYYCQYDYGDRDDPGVEVIGDGDFEDWDSGDGDLSGDGDGSVPPEMMPPESAMGGASGG